MNSGVGFAPLQDCVGTSMFGSKHETCQQERRRKKDKKDREHGHRSVSPVDSRAREGFSSWPGAQGQPQDLVLTASPTLASPEARLQAAFPQASPDKVRKALKKSNGSLAQAALRLIRASSHTEVPDGIPLPMRSACKRALLVGVNYFGSNAELRGCLNDVDNMQSLLVRTFNWPLDAIRTLRDDNHALMPTLSNIERGLRWLVEGVQPGDSLFFHFSGHGAQQEDPHGYEEDGMNETILPVDFMQAGMITDDHIGDVIVKQLPEGVRLTCLLDCCHSGTGLDLPFMLTSSGWKEETNPYHSRGDVVMLSGCEDMDCSADASDRYGNPGGAMTTALCDALQGNRSLTYRDLLTALRRNLQRRGFTQRPQLTSTQRFDLDRHFGFDDAIANRNPKIGRTLRKKFPPKPRRMEGPLASELLEAGLLCGFTATLGTDFAGPVMGAPGSVIDTMTDMGYSGMGAVVPAMDPITGMGSSIGSTFGSMFGW